MPLFLREAAQALYYDLRYTLRQLRNAPVYALTAVLTLALGLGAATAMLAIADSVLLRPVALPHAEQLVGFAQIVAGKQLDTIGFQDFEILRTRSKSFEALTGTTTLPSPVTTPDGTRLAALFRVEPGFFDVPGLPARFGRVLTMQDAHAPVAVVSDEFWQNRLGGSHGAVGSAIKVDGRIYNIAGIMPPGFSFPYLTGEAVYVPLLQTAKEMDEHGFASLSLFGRLRPGVSKAAAQAETAAIFAHAAKPDEQNRGKLILRSYRDTLTGDEQPALLALLGACALLLVIACVNSANLQIARAAARTGEISVRAALGATRGRLLRQLATESVTISLLGAALGLVLASVAVHGIGVGYSHDFRRFNELALHPAAFAACALLAVLTGVLAALAPAWSAMQTAAGLSLTQAARTTRRSRLSGWLVATEIALTCVLLVTGGLLLRTFRALEQTPLGFNPQHVTEMTLMPVNPQEGGEALKQTHERLLERLGNLPGVMAATTQSSLPFSNFTLGMTSTFRIAGKATNKNDQTGLSLVSAGYDVTMGVRPLEGRGFLPSDTMGLQPVCLVNEAFVRRYLQGRRALGSSVAFTNEQTHDPDDRFFKGNPVIVGVLPDQIGGRSLDETPGPMLFMSFAQYPAQGDAAKFLFGLAPQFAVRSALPQATLKRELRAALKEAAPDMAEMQMGSMEENIAASLTRQKLALRLAGGFGLLALALAGVGIYGVLASAVAQRTREIGIRMALGSSRRAAMGLVLRQAGAMVLLGLLGGLLCAWPAGRAVKAFLFGVAPLDPLTLVTATAALLVVCACAAAVPAWRATQVDPIVALRSE